MKKQYTIVLGKCYPGPDEENWPTEENTSCKYVLNSKTALYRQMKKLIDSWAAPWWWIFDGDITEDFSDPDSENIIEFNGIKSELVIAREA
jgi:hypothetical protein